jgi:hypothetical protein
MSADDPGSLPPGLQAWLEAERPLAEVPAATRARIYARLRRSVGYGGTGGGGGPAGAAGLSGSFLGGLLAILLAAGAVTFFVGRALLNDGNRSSPGPLTAAGDSGRPFRGQAAAPGDPGRPFGPPRWRSGAAGMDTPAGASAGAGSGAGTAASEGESGRTLPPWVGQRNVERQRVAGVVLDRGRPAPGVEVILEGIASPADQHFTQRRVTGPDGRFSFGPQPAWQHVVSASASGRRPAAIRFRIGDPTARPAPDALVLELGDCSAGLWGVVSDQSGQGVPEVRVRRTLDGFNGPTVDTDASGRYEVCADPGPVRLRVEGEGYGVVLASGSAGPDRPRLDVRLSSEAVASGTTVALDGTPLPHVQLNLVSSGRGTNTATPPAMISTISDDQGRFEARGLAPGRYWMNAWAADHMGRESAWFEVRAGEIKRGLVRRLHPTSLVDATVFSHGQPVAGAAINLSIRGTEDDSSFGAVTQSDGRVTLHGVFRGDNEFRLRKYRVVGPASLVVEGSRLSGVILEVEPLTPAAPAR